MPVPAPPRPRPGRSRRQRRAERVSGAATILPQGRTCFYVLTRSDPPSCDRSRPIRFFYVSGGGPRTEVRAARAAGEAVHPALALQHRARPLRGGRVRPRAGRRVRRRRAGGGRATRRARRRAARGERARASCSSELPDYERLVEVAVGETERSVRGGRRPAVGVVRLDSRAPPCLERGGAVAGAAARRVRVRAARRARGRGGSGRGCSSWRQTGGPGGPRS